MVASVAREAEPNPLVGVWALDEGYQIVAYLFRSDGRYRLDTRSTDPDFGYSSTDAGRYTLDGRTLTLTPYEYLGEPQSARYETEVAGGALTLTTADHAVSRVYQLTPGSRDEVLAREKVDRVLIGTWGHSVRLWGRAEYTFRPGGYYVLKNTPEDSQFPPEYIRGRYAQDGARLTLTPYSGTDAPYEIDFFADTLTIIKADEVFGESTTYGKLPGSEAEVRAKAAEAEAFLGRENWHVGVWEIRDAIHTVDLTIRPDGRYVAKEETEFLKGIVRGRYTLEPRRIHLVPFIGQGLYARSNGEFGKVERTRELDYYDGELQFIELEAISQSVTIARKRPKSEAPVMEKVRLARAQRAREGWCVGVWEVNDPAGWMEFTYRPDGRYIAKSGADGVPHEVERGRYVVGSDKVTLAPYAGLGPPRGFELDLYDGELFLVGDLSRMVVARKLTRSSTVVTKKTRDPEATKGERGSILGRWTAKLPGQSAELVFRPDGEFRLSRCVNSVVSQDYGLYAVEMPARTLVSDSRFVDVQTHGLDFYGDTLTIFGGTIGGPRSYTVNLGVVDAAIEASLAADAAEARVDAQWLARVPVGPRDPNAVQIPTADIPADPNPARIFDAPTVLTNFQLYRRLIAGFVYFNDRGTIRSVPVVNTREWYFFPTGRVLVRFRNHRAGFSYPTTVVDVTDSWGAYRVEPRGDQRDILHLYADNAVFIETDAGERIATTLEDGRRMLFWNKDYQILSEWAAEQKPVPCQAPADADRSLMNTGVSLATNIAPDPIEESKPLPSDRTAVPEPAR
jgi:hypothetical protein